MLDKENPIVVMLCWVNMRIFFIFSENKWMLFQHFINFFEYINIIFHWEFAVLAPPTHTISIPASPSCSACLQRRAPASVNQTYVRRSIFIHINLLHYYTCVNIQKYVLNGKFKKNYGRM